MTSASGAAAGGVFDHADRQRAALLCVRAKTGGAFYHVHFPFHFRAGPPWPPWPCLFILCGRRRLYIWAALLLFPLIPPYNPPLYGFSLFGRAVQKSAAGVGVDPAGPAARAVSGIRAGAGVKMPAGVIPAGGPICGAVFNGRRP